MKKIEVEDEVFEELQHRAEPLVDTPNTVLRRVLGMDGQSGIIDSAFTPKAKSRRRQTRSYNGRLPPGVRTPAQEFRQPILKSLVELGGSAPKNEVLDRVGTMMDGSLKDVDRATNKSGGTRWRNTAEWERFNMIQDELMSGKSKRGIWEVTTKGRQAIED